MNKNFNSVMKFIAKKTKATKDKKTMKKLVAAFPAKKGNEFDASLDKTIASVDIASGEKGMIVVGVYSYNNGVPKIGVTRQYEKKDGTTGFGAMGRLTTEEAVEVVKAITKLLGA